MKIVTPENFSEVLETLSGFSHLSCDTETTGFYAYKKDDLFSIQFSDANEDYYFNFIEYSNNEPRLFFSQIEEMQKLFVGKTLFLQNAKFDMHFLYKHGIRFDRTTFHDTEVAGRLIRNDHLKYSLDEQAKRELGEAKDDAVMEWIKENKAFTATEIPGKDTVIKALHFDQVPYEIITKYGCKDTRLTYDLGMKQIGQLKELTREAGGYERSVQAVFDMEMKLTHACFEMERVGIQIDREYCGKAVEVESARIHKNETNFLAATGIEITDSGKCLGPIFEGLGFTPGRTDTDEYEITDAFLNTVDHPVARIVQDYRDARKRANTYFKSYMYFADRDGMIHANMKQAGTKTGRFSYMDPNLQNIPKGDKDADDADQSDYPIRRAFIPRKGFFFLAIDYKQMEFRMMLDEAGQHDLINKIKAGHDPHIATADLTGLSRKSAKTLNFGLLYGMGLVKLAFAILKMTAEQKKALLSYDRYQKMGALALMDPEEKKIADPIIAEVKGFKRQYFDRLPMVQHFIIQCTNAVKTRCGMFPGSGWIKTWFGRRGYFDDPMWAYKASNFKIQGGCADLVKLVMIKLHEYLTPYKSRMVLQIHDELLFEIAHDERVLIGEILNIMETTYPHRFLPLTCSVSYSLQSFYDLIEKDPRLDLVEKGRNSIQGQDSAETSAASEHVVCENSAANH